MQLLRHYQNADELFLSVFSLDQGHQSRNEKGQSETQTSPLQFRLPCNIIACFFCVLVCVSVLNYKTHSDKLKSLEVKGNVKRIFDVSHVQYFKNEFILYITQHSFYTVVMLHVWG